MNRYISIRWKLILPFVVLVGIILGVLLPGVQLFLEHQFIAEADQRLAKISSSVAALIEDTEQQILVEAGFVSNLNELVMAGENIEKIKLVLTKNKDVLGVEELSFYAQNYQPGDLPLYYGGPVIARRQQVSERVLAVRNALLKEVTETGIPTAEIVFGAQSSQVIGVSPVGDGGGGIVMAVTYINVEYLQRIADILGADIAIIVDNAPIASTLDGESDYEALLKSEINMDGIENFAITFDYDQITTRLLTQPLVLHGETHGFILISQPIQEVFEVLEKIDQLFILFAAIVTSASVLFGLGVLVNFSRPVQKLLAATRLVSDGEFSVRLGKLHGFFSDEITELGDNFNGMTARLEELYTGLEDKVSERTQELEDALAQLEITRDQALEASRTKSTFLANMSHELRTPLNAIIGYSEMLQEDAEDNGYIEMEQDLSKILASSKHLLGMINDVLDLSKIEAGKMSLYLEDFDLRDVITSTAESVRTLIEGNNNVFEIEFLNDVGMIRSDVTKVRQVMLNLLSNSAKFTKNGKITIQTHRKQVAGREAVILKVKDTGIGMNEEQVNQLFQAFVQGDDSTTRNYGGTGLGLTITKHYCRMMGGDIVVTSQEGSGTEFLVTLPVDAESDINIVDSMKGAELIKRIKTEPILAQSVNGNGSSGCKVLVIDDDAVSRDLMTRHLERENYQVITAASGTEGIAMAIEQKPDVITLDVIMPDIDGWSILSAIKTNPDIKDTPVIMVSMLADHKTGFALGASDYLVKPVDREQLKKILNKYRCNQSMCRVLLIEDDKDSREMMRRLLDREGWLTVEAVNGQEALKMVDEVKPDVILLDLMMPVMDGFEFIDAYRNQMPKGEVPVVVITSKELTDDDKSRLSGLVNNIFQKASYSKDELLDQVKALIASHLE